MHGVDAGGTRQVEHRCAPLDRNFARDLETMGATIDEP